MEAIVQKENGNESKGFIKRFRETKENKDSENSTPKLNESESNSIEAIKRLKKSSDIFAETAPIEKPKEKIFIRDEVHASTLYKVGESVVDDEGLVSRVVALRNDHVMAYSDLNGRSYRYNYGEIDKA